MTVAAAALGDIADAAPVDVGDVWGDAGVIILPGLVPGPVIDEYAERFIVDAADRAGVDGPFNHRRDHDAYYDRFDTELAVGYGIGTPYLGVPELRDVAMHRDIVAALDGIHGEPMGLHLNLTGWRSTRRGFHQDQYLNPPCVGMAYAAVWVALDDIDADAGPFEYVPGSHRWPRVNRAKLLAAMGEDGSDPDWPWRSEAILGPVFDHEIGERGATVERFIARRGDVLIWHANLCHRGSVPVDATLERRALISHWSVVSRRCDMPTTRRWTSEHADGLMFALGPVT